MDNPYSKFSAEQLEKMIAQEEQQSNPYSNFSEDELEKMIAQEEKKAQKDTYGKALARGAKDVASGLIGALPDLAALPYYAYKSAKGEHVTPLTESISEFIDTHTGGYTKAHTPRQKVMSSVIQAIGGIPTFGGSAKLLSKGLMHGAKQLPKATKYGHEFLKESGKFSGTNLGGTAGAAAASQHMANVTPDNAIAPFLAGIAGSAVGSRVGNFRSRGPASYIAEKISYDPRIHEKFKKIDIEPTLADVAHSKSLKRAEDSLHHGLFSSSAIAKKKAQQMKKIKKNLEGYDFESEDIYPAYRGSEMLQENIGKYKKQHNQRMDAKEAEIDHLLDNLPEDKAYANVNDIISHYEKKKSKYRSALGKELLEEDEASKLIKKLQGDAYESKLDAQTLRKMRQKVDKQINFDKVNYGTEDDQLLKLRTDLRNVLAKHSTVDPHLEKAWKETQQAHHHYLSKELPILNRYTLSQKSKGQENKPFLDLLNDLTNKKTNAKDFSYIRDKIISHEDKLKFTQLGIHQLGMKNGAFDLFHFKNQFLHKLNPLSQDALLMGISKGDKKKFIDNLHALDQLGIKEGNVTGSGHTVNMGRDINDISHATSDLALSQDPSSWIKLAGKLGATLGAGKIMTSKSLINKMDKAFKAKSPRQQQEYLKRISEEVSLPKYRYLPLKTARRVGLKKEESDEKKKLHIMMTPSKAYQIS